MELPKFLQSGDCGPIGKNCCTERYLGFESLTLRQKLDPNVSWDFFFYDKQ